MGAASSRRGRGRCRSVRRRAMDDSCTAPLPSTVGRRRSQDVYRILKEAERSEWAEAKWVRLALTATDADRRTALHLAAAAGRAEAVGALLRAGAPLDRRDASGATPLHLAAYWGQAATARLLLRAGADPNDEYTVDLGALEREARIKRGEEQVQNEERTSRRGRRGAGDGRQHRKRARRQSKRQHPESEDLLALSPMHMAAGGGHVALLEELIETGANMEVKSSTGGTTPLHMAVAGGHEEAMLALLAAGVDPNCVDACMETPLHVAAFTGRAHIVGRLIDAGANCSARDKSGATPLHTAAAAGYAEVLRRLMGESEEDLKRKTDPAAKGDNTEAQVVDPGDGLAWNRQALRDLYFDISAGFAESIRVLLEAGADPQATDSAGASPLHHAAYWGRCGPVKVLLEAGCDKEARAFLHLRAPFAKTTPPAILEVLSPGEGEDVLPELGLTPLQMAAVGGSVPVVRQLLAAGAARSAEERRGGRQAIHIAALAGQEKVVQMLLNNGVTPDERDWRKRTALHEAVKGGHAKVVEILLDAGGDVNATDKAQVSPLLDAAAQNNAGIVRTLVAAGADIEAAGGALKRAPMHVAAAHGSIGVLSALSASRAAASARDATGATPLHLAATPEAARALLAAGADPNVCDVNGVAALHSAALRRHGGLVKAMLHAKADPCIAWEVFVPCKEQSRSDWLLNHIKNVAESYKKCTQPTYSTTYSVTDIEDGTALDEPIYITVVHILAALGDKDALVEVLHVWPEDKFIWEGSDVTPFHLAALAGHSLLLNVLLERYASAPHLCDIFGCTPLHVALDQPAVNAILLKWPDLLHVKDLSGMTPLHAAVEARRADAAAALVVAGAATDAVDNAGRRPRDVAREVGLKDLNADLLGLELPVNRRCKACCCVS